jgi:hypothetical protein
MAAILRFNFRPMKSSNEFKFRRVLLNVVTFDTFNRRVARRCRSGDTLRAIRPEWSRKSSRLPVVSVFVPADETSGRQRDSCSRILNKFQTERKEKGRHEKRPLLWLSRENVVSGRRHTPPPSPRSVYSRLDSISIRNNSVSSASSWRSNRFVGDNGAK